tara:strand:+ start:312 stop:800 length:489 start_codon:yes stop_codon:yes gene_type:complete
MDFIIIIIVILLLLIGLIGCIIPALPGPPISFSGLLLFHFFTSYNLEEDTLWLLAAVVVAITFLDYWLQVYGVKKFGGGKKAINGTILGLVLGLLLFPPFGLIIGPFVGAFLGAKMEAKEDTNRAIKIALGALAGFLGGTVLKFAVSIYISILFLNQLFPIF